MKGKGSQKHIIIIKTPNETLKEKNFVERNPSLWNFLTSLVGIGALVVSICVMINSNRASKINFDNFERQVKAENQRRFEDSIFSRAKEIRDSTNFARQDSVNILTLKAFSDQAKAANEALGQQKFNYDLEKNNNRPVLNVDSVGCIKSDGGYFFVFSLSNIGKRPLRTTRSTFFVVNIPKNFCVGTFSPSNDITFPGIGFSLFIKRIVPDSIMLDPYTSLFIKVNYRDELLNKNEVLIQNYYWEGLYEETTNLNVMNKATPFLVKSITQFINFNSHAEIVK
jgi:hypothetical protein